MLQTDTEKASTRFDHGLSRIPITSSAGGAIQTKLAINEPGDSYEQEADRMAEQVMRTPEPRLHAHVYLRRTVPQMPDSAGGPGT